MGFAAPGFPVSSFSRLSAGARWPGWVCATARVLLIPALALQQGCKGLSYSNPSAAHPLASPTALLLSIMWEPQRGVAARLLLLWQLSRVSAAQGSPEPAGPGCSHRAGTFHIHNKSPWSLGLAPGSVLSLPIMVGVAGGVASGQSSQDYIQGLCLVMEVLQKTPFAGVSDLLSDIYAVSVKSRKRGLQQAARKKQE